MNHPCTEISCTSGPLHARAMMVAQEDLEAQDECLRQDLACVELRELSESLRVKRSNPPQSGMANVNFFA